MISLNRRHGGDVPGFTSQVTRVPALGVGFFTAINDDDVGAVLKGPIVYRILDDLLGLEPIDWEERLVTRAFRKAPNFTPVPKHPRPAPMSDKIVGSYHGDGYSTISIVEIEDQDASISPATLKAIKETLGTIEGVSKPLYLSSLARVFTAVMVFSHFDGPIFNATALSINTNNTTVVINVGGQSTAVFVKDEGFGMFEDFWGGVKGKRAVEVDVEEQCEVWFRRT